MKILTIYLPVILLLSTLLFFFKIFSKSIQPVTRFTHHYPLPPGKTGWPIIGETLEFLSHMWRGTLERFFHDRIRKYESTIFKTSLFGDQTMVLYGAAGNKFLFANEDKLVRSSAPVTVRKLLPITSDIEKVVRLRNLTHSVLKPDSLQKHVGFMDSMAKSHFQDKWNAKNQVMVYRMAKDYTFTLACRLLVSLDDTDLIQELATSIDGVVDGVVCLPINLPWTQFGRAIRASKAVNTRLITIFRKKRQELALAIEKEVNYKDNASNQDILSSILVHANENDTYISDSEMADWILGILIAGHRTGVAAITMIFKYLGESPEIYHKVYQEQMEIAKNKTKGELLNFHDILKMKYSWNVAQEAMRIHPPALGAFKEAISDFTYSDYHIPKGCKLQLSIQATHRDEKYFPNPEKFDPSRFEKDGPLPYTFVPFGGGPRMCPARSYAQMEILVFLHNAVTRFKWENILPSEEIILDPFPRPKTGLPIKLHPHQTHNFQA